MVFFTIRLMRRRIHLSREGLLQIVGQSVRLDLFADCAFIEEEICQNYFLLHFPFGYFFPLHVSRSYALHYPELKQVWITGTLVADLGDFGSRLKQIATERSIPWVVSHTDSASYDKQYDDPIILDRSED